MTSKCSLRAGIDVEYGDVQWYQMYLRKNGRGLRASTRPRLTCRPGLLTKGLEGVEETARNALAKGCAFELIHDITGLDIQTIKNLRTQGP